MERKSYKIRHTFTVILFILTTVINYLSASGVIFPNNQQDISYAYQNLLAPASFTFSIWGVIYLGVAVTLVFPWFKKMSPDFENLYYNNVLLFYIAWMFFNIAWTITWVYDVILLALIAILGYTFSLLLLVRKLDKRRDLTFKQPWLLLFPIGLHTGWLIFASFANVMALLVKYGFDPYSQTGVIVTTIMMIVACLAVLLVFNQVDNSFITVPALWALFGIFMKHRPGSGFAQANQTVMITSVVLFVISLIVHFLILKKHRETRPI